MDILSLYKEDGYLKAEVRIGPTDRYSFPFCLINVILHLKAIPEIKTINGIEVDQIPNIRSFSGAARKFIYKNHLDAIRQSLNSHLVNYN